MENQILGSYMHQDLIEENSRQMAALQERQDEIEVMIHIRCEKHQGYISPPGLVIILSKPCPDTKKVYLETEIQAALDKQYLLARNTLILKGMSFVGMSILAFTLFSLVNPSSL